MTNFNTSALAEARTHARRLHQRGLAVVALCRPEQGKRCSAPWHDQPCRDVGKRPLVKGYPQFPIEKRSWGEIETELVRFAPSNIGIVTGGDIVVIEADTREAENEIVRLGGNMIENTPTRTRRMSRGRAYLLRAPAGVVIPTRSKLGTSGAIDVRGASGILVVPPSLHWTGHLLQWLRNKAPWQIEFAEIGPSLLELALKVPRTRLHSQRVVEHRKLVGQLSPRVDFLLGARLKLARLWYGEGKTYGDSSASGYDYTIASELLTLGVSPREVAEAIAIRPGAHRRDAGYCTRTVETALMSRRRG